MQCIRVRESAHGMSQLTGKKCTHVRCYLTKWSILIYPISINHHLKGVKWVESFSRETHKWRLSVLVLLINACLLCIYKQINISKYIIFYRSEKSGMCAAAPCLSGRRWLHACRYSPTTNTRLPRKYSSSDFHILCVAIHQLPILACHVNVCHNHTSPAASPRTCVYLFIYFLSILFFIKCYCFLPPISPA